MFHRLRSFGKSVPGNLYCTRFARDFHQQIQMSTLWTEGIVLRRTNYLVEECQKVLCATFSPRQSQHLESDRKLGALQLSPLGFLSHILATMTLTFYHCPMSTSSITEAVLAELGTPHEVVTMSLSAGDTKKPDFVKLNPNARVPVIVHDGTAIWESAAITMYLGEQFGVEAKLYPDPGPRRGEAMMWITWTNVSLAEAAGRLYRALHMGADDNPEKARSDIAVLLGRLDGALEGKEFLLGEFTLVDAHMQGIFGWITYMNISLTSFPNVQAWYGRCTERPAMKKLRSK